MCTKRNQYECYFVQRLHKSNINLNEIRLRSIWIKLNWETIEVLISTFAEREENMWMKECTHREMFGLFSQQDDFYHICYKKKNIVEKTTEYIIISMFLLFFWCFSCERTWNENLFNNLFFRRTWKTWIVTTNATTKSFPYYLFTV